MPTYQYRCAKCGEQFELWQSIHDDALQKHPGCGGSVTKVMAPAGIVLNEYYKTDEDYFHALAAELNKEYRAIVAAGLLLQVDDPFLSEEREPADLRSTGA